MLVLPALRCCLAFLAGSLHAVSATATATGPTPGALLVAGGGLKADNEAVHRAFLAALPSPGRVAIIAAASGSPVASARRAADVLQTFGVHSSMIAPVRLAVQDDNATTDVDESAWASFGSNPAEIAKVTAADAIWFTGGDQSRLAQTLLQEDGSATPMLQAIRDRLAAGATLGGTSAGAAIMSNPMITGGDPAAALGLITEGEPLGLGPGLGFFTQGLVDQHFDTRARLGRLAVALRKLPPERRIGFGVDENTAFRYDLGTDALCVIGAATVSVVDGRRARWRETKGRIGIRNLSISVLSAGDCLQIADGSIRSAASRKATVGSEYYAVAPLNGGGMALPATSLAQLLGQALLDNRIGTRIERYSFLVADENRGEDSSGVVYRFRQTEASRGYWGYDESGMSSYTIVDVALEIEAVAVKIVPQRSD